MPNAMPVAGRALPCPGASLGAAAPPWWAATPPCPGASIGVAAPPWWAASIYWGGSTALVGGNAALPWRIYWGGSTVLVGGNATLPWHISWGGSTALVGGNAALPWHISWGGSTALVGGNAALPCLGWQHRHGRQRHPALAHLRQPRPPGYRRRGLWGIPCFSEGGRRGRPLHPGALVGGKALRQPLGPAATGDEACGASPASVRGKGSAWSPEDCSPKAAWWAARKAPPCPGASLGAAVPWPPAATGDEACGASPASVRGKGSAWSPEDWAARLPQSGLVGGKEGAAPLGCMSRQHAAQQMYPLLIQGGEGLIQNPEGRGD